MRSRILVSTLFGAAAGFLGFLLQERLVVHDPVLTPPMPEILKLGALVGVMLGIGIGSVEGVVTGSARTLLRGTIRGAAIGTVGGMFGVYVGSIVYNAALFGKDPFLLAQSRGLLDFTHAVLARALGWTFLGAFPGLAAGAATLSGKRAVHGLVGGLLGGFVGGFAFDLVATLFSQPLQGMASASVSGPQIIEIGGPSRAVGFTAIGTLAGFFIGLVEEMMKQAWVRVLVGRNEGRDYIISRPLTILGRDERADIPLFADPSLAPQHAAISMENNRHVLLDGGTPMGVMVNGQRVQKAVLKDGDMIQLGQVRLLFREKATASRVASPRKDLATGKQQPGHLSVPSNLCQFCGAPKDAAGNCLCTVGAATGGGTGSSPVPPPAMPAGPGAPVSEAGLAPIYTAGPLGAVPLAGQGSRLVALDGPHAGQSFALSLPVVSIGRDAARDIVLSQDPSVSRRHARIEEQAGVHVLVDEGSSNGTFVNGVRIETQPLALGDIIQMGAGSYRYE